MIRFIVGAFTLLGLCLFSSNGLANKADVTIDEPTDEIYSQFQGAESSYTGPLPWENNPVFVDSIEKNLTPVRMAAFKATLHDPILAEAYNIQLAAQKLAGTIVQPGATFSQNSTIGPYTSYHGYQAGPTYAGNQITTTIGGGVCKIASLLYNVAVFSNLPIIMRYPHSMTVPYVPPGQDATVYYGAKDFRFINNTKEPILIWAEKVDNTLYMAIYGQEKPPKITWRHKIEKRINYWTIFRKNSNLAPGETKCVIPGQDGYIVKSWVYTELPTGEIMVKDRGRSYYNALPSVIEKGF